MIAALADVALLGGMLLCGETRDLDVVAGVDRATKERAAIVQTVRAYVAEYGSTPEREIQRRGRYVPSSACGLRELRRLNALFWRLWNDPASVPQWARKAYAFATPAAARRVRDRWTKRGFVEVPQSISNTVHVFFVRP